MDEDPKVGRDGAMWISRRGTHQVEARARAKLCSGTEACSRSYEEAGVAGAGDGGEKSQRGQRGTEWATRQRSWGPLGSFMQSSDKIDLTWTRRVGSGPPLESNIPASLSLIVLALSAQPASTVLSPGRSSAPSLGEGHASPSPGVDV